MKELHLPVGYRVAPSGQSKEMGRTGQPFMAAFGMSFVFMYLVLATSLLSPS